MFLVIGEHFFSILESIIWSQHIAVAFIIEVIVYLIFIIYKNVLEFLCSISFTAAKVFLMDSIVETLNKVNACQLGRTCVMRN